MIDRDRNTDQHHRAFRLLGGETVGHSETLLYFNGVVPLGFKRGFKFKSAKIDDAAYGEILREGNIGADPVRGAGAGGAAAALGERDRGLAGVVVLDILVIRRRLHNGKHLRIVNGVFLAGVVCNNAVAVDIRRRQRDFGDAPCVHTPAAAAQTVFGVVHHIFALACALIRTGCLAAVVVRRLVVITADVYGAAVSGRYRKQNLLTTRRVAVKIADDRLVDDLAVLQNIVQTIGFYLRSFQRSVIVLEDLTADDDIRHSAASVKPHDTQRTRVHALQVRGVLADPVRVVVTVLLHIEAALAGNGFLIVGLLRRVHLIAVAGVPGDDCEIAFVMEVIVIVVVIRADTGGDDLYRAVVVDILRAACRCTKMPACIVLVRRLIGGIHMAELIGPDGLPVAVANLGQHHHDRAALGNA